MNMTQNQETRPKTVPRPHLLTIRELWLALDRKIGLETLRRWAASGRLRSLSIGRKRLVPASEIERIPELAEGGDR